MLLFEQLTRFISRTIVYDTHKAVQVGVREITYTYAECSNLDCSHYSKLQALVRRIYDKFMIHTQDCLD